MKKNRTKNGLVLFVLVLFIAIIIIRLFSMRESKFDSEIWKSVKYSGFNNIRYRMLEDLKTKIKANSINSRKQVIELLGDSESDSIRRKGSTLLDGWSSVVYYLGFENKFIPSRQHYLVIVFDNDGQIIKIDTRPY